MALGTRQTNIFAAEDWKKLYTTFSEADFQSYDFETIRKVMVDYLKTYYAEDFNDFIESSEYIALLDLIAFVAQGLAFRTDLNARENFLETAERRDSVIKLVKSLSYSPNRNKTSSGLLKIQSISTSEPVVSVTGINLANTRVNWNDSSNLNWSLYWNSIMNAAFSSSQKIGKPYAAKTINNIRVEQYNIAVPTTIVPVFSFNSIVAENNLPFEIVSANIVSSDMISEQDPGVRGQFGLIYQQDGRGATSATNGYFLYFKQGQLQSFDINITEKLPNRIVEIPVNNINNEDIWLYEIDANRIGAKWTKVVGMNGTNTIYNSTAKNIRTLYSVNTRLNDQIDLLFGDGTFSNMPEGSYRTYFRVSSGTTYRISPIDMSNVSIVIPYISRNGRPESLSIVASLQYTVANSSNRDSIDEIKAKAPQNYYTQNRMVNGEDYNIFPYTRYADIVKVKAVNRFSSGISRGLDILDPTGRYSSTDIFSDDGAIFKDETLKTKTFNFNNRNEATAAVRNMLLPLLRLNATYHFYLDKLGSVNLAATAPTKWERVTDDAGSCTGYFLNMVGDRQLVGSFASSNRKFLIRNSLIKFEAPLGFYFDINNVLTAGTPTLSEDKTVIWASVQNQSGNGTADIFFAGRDIGAITLSENIPSGALVTEVYAPFATSLSSATTITLTNLIVNNQDFGLRYDQNATSLANVDPWKIIAGNDLDITNEFNIADAGNTSGTASDSSWFVRFTSNSDTNYTISYRGLDYVFCSREKVRFLNVLNQRTYDSKTNTVIKDNIKVLKINTQDNANVPLGEDISFEVIENLVETDGYIDTSKVLVTFTDNNNNSIIENPSAFKDISNSNIKNVFFEKYLDLDNLVRYKLLPSGEVNNLFATKSSIELQRNNYPVGKVFYASTDDRFFIITIINGIKTVVETTNYRGYVGRQGLYFQYRHNASDTRRIDPATTNLIDIYVLTRNYDNLYRSYIADFTNSIKRPEEPSSFELNNDYKELFEYKMLSDGLIINAGKYKPLFGSKAPENLQAIFQAVKELNSTISDNELKSKIIAAMNEYFSLENWEFGDTFYFSELSAFLHQKLSGFLASIIIIPRSANATFGSLYEIRCQPNELFINSATVDDIEIVPSVLSGLNQSGVNTSTIIRGVAY
jgi:hypothetical protein